jgi:hypothetical protein
LGKRKERQVLEALLKEGRHKISPELRAQGDVEQWEVVPRCIPLDAAGHGFSGIFATPCVFYDLMRRVCKGWYL